MLMPTKPEQPSNCPEPQQTLKPSQKQNASTIQKSQLPTGSSVVEEDPAEVYSWKDSILVKEDDVEKAENKAFREEVRQHMKEDDVETAENKAFRDEVRQFMNAMALAIESLRK
ncbi:hypothetical protein ACHAQJ_007198 [Trichoderma viride]